MAHPSYLSKQLNRTTEVQKGDGKETIYPYFADEELCKAVNNDSTVNGIRLGYGALSETELEEGITALARALR